MNQLGPNDFKAGEGKCNATLTEADVRRIVREELRAHVSPRALFSSIGPGGPLGTEAVPDERWGGGGPLWRPEPKDGDICTDGHTVWKWNAKRHEWIVDKTGVSL